MRIHFLSRFIVIASVLFLLAGCGGNGGTPMEAMDEMTVVPTPTPLMPEPEPSPCDFGPVSGSCTYKQGDQTLTLEISEDGETASVGGTSSVGSRLEVNNLVVVKTTTGWEIDAIPGLTPPPPPDYSADFTVPTNADFGEFLGQGLLGENFSLKTNPDMEKHVRLAVVDEEENIREGATSSSININTTTTNSTTQSSHGTADIPDVNVQVSYTAKEDERYQVTIAAGVIVDSNENAVGKTRSNGVGENGAAWNSVKMESTEEIDGISNNVYLNVLTDAPKRGPLEPQLADNTERIDLMDVTQLGGTAATPVRIINIDFTGKGPGTLNGLTGEFSCATNCRQPNPQVGEKLAETFKNTGWMFTPYTGGVRVPKDLTNYLSLGMWLQVPNTGTNDAPELDAMQVGVFADGADPYNAMNINQVTGTATYEGQATGIYASQREGVPTAVVDYFAADTTLTADFEDVEDFGSISGMISNIMVGAQSVGGYLELNDADLSNASITFVGETEGTIGGKEYEGQWGGMFYGDGDDTKNNIIDLTKAAPQPGSVAGTFGAFSDENGTSSFLGAFGAYKD